MKKIILPFMVLQGEQKHITENYVSVPPALIITDETGAIWTLGFNFGIAPKGEYAFNVLRNGVDVGETASRIERRKNEIWIFTASGWKRIKTMKMEAIQIFAVGARLSVECNEPISVKVYFDARHDIPAVSYNFNPQSPDIYDLTRNPLICIPSQWLYARVEPTRFEPFTTVMAYLGGKNMREIPILKGA